MFSRRAYKLALSMACGVARARAPPRALSAQKVVSNVGFVAIFPVLQPHL